MHRLPSHFAPPPIAIADEPLDAGSVSSPAVSVLNQGFELVPTWQTRPTRWPRPLAATAIVLALGAAAAFAADRGDRSERPRERLAASASELRPAGALVVTAAPVGQNDQARSRR
jgi:hypothetical protein